MSKVFFKIFFYSLILVPALFFVSPVFAAYEKISPGNTIALGEFVYDDNFVATTSACTISIYNPSSSLIVNEAVMSTTTAGWHFYNFSATNSEGNWPVAMTCGSVAGGDLAKLDKTFVVGYANASTTAISDSVWNAGSKTLTDYATSSISTAVWNNTTRTLSAFGTLVADIWGAGTRTMTSLGSLAADVWNNTFAPTRRLTDATLTGGGNIATQADIASATSTLITEINENQTLIAALNNISATDVWTAGTRTLTDTATSAIATAVWSRATSTLVAIGGSVGKQLVENLDTQISTRGTSNLTAADVWNAATRTLTDYSTSTVAAAVWANAARTLTNYGNDITAQNVWDVLSSSLTTTNSIGKQLAENVVASTTIAAAVWNNTTRTLSSFGTLVADTATAVWASGTRTLSSFGTLAADVWSNATRRLTDATLTGGGNIATQLDVQTASSSLGALINTRASLSNQIAGWTVAMSNTDRVLAGNTYRAKIFLTNYLSTPANSFAAPAITLYDSARNIVASGIAMTNLSAGVYEYTYSIPAAAAQGLWESTVSTEVESGKTIQTNDYWTVEGSPAQVIINSITDDTTPSISANVTISNEGLTGYEYHYEWCVVTSVNNSCGGGDDTFYASASKYINAGADWNTNLTATVPTAGDYYFKLVVYYGVEQSGASRSFAAFSLAPTLSQETFRFYTNKGSLAPDDPWPPGSLNNGENSDIFEGQFPPLFGQVIRLRTGLKVTSRGLPVTQKQFKMQFAELTVSSCLNQSSGWTDMGNPGSSALWRGLDMSSLTDGAALPSNLLSTGNIKGSYEEQNPTPYNPAVAVNQTVEYDWTLQNNVPTPTGKNYCFRVVESDGTAFDAYTRYPRIATMFAPIGSNSSTINYATGGDLQFANPNGSQMTLTVPPNYLPASQSFDMFSFNASTYINQIGTQPSGKSSGHAQVYRLAAENGNVPSSSFDQPLTLKINYSDSEISSLTESSLVIYKYDGGDWVALSTTVDTANNTATAAVTSFSSFGLFGDAVATPTPTATQNAGGGGGGIISTTPVPSIIRNAVDFNNDGKVNSVDFSIMLFFWKAKPPFSNPFVDTNNDGKVNSIDFSILMYQWGSKK